MKLRQGDLEFQLLSEEDLMWAEADAVERVTGMTMAEIGAKGQVCGCGHRIAQHKPVDPDAEEKTFVCVECQCDQPLPNLPSMVTQALLWVSMKRASPELSFSQTGQFAMADLTTVKDEDPPDPPEGEATT